MKNFLPILFAGFLIAGISGSSGRHVITPQSKKIIIVADTITFVQQIQPVLVKNCSPCHFPGGKMYAKLPFDVPQTIVTLKKERVLMRLKNEEEKELVKRFIEQKQ